ncbi:MAG: type IV pilin protein [Candidatus Omnitrophota bacterium]|nr:type IV pilin protein [Candidatus Omnitrophota bacterium]MDZ4242646.1 type IV pilin protein [Candidatus Omnitrophota bacterium]
MNRKAFTLVEILLVVGIIALLATIAIPNLLRSRLSANESSAQSTLKTISTALESYYVTNNNYPNNTNLLIGDVPPYLNKDFFVGSYSGYSYTSNLGDYYYTITATPVSASTGLHTFTITTGAVLQQL